ncbi:putative vacuolar cation/proton exchanger 2 [Microthyrium microscopicum]|uniref:Vacuolar calcium ion transporter n=1 Tax=Microthyrium microscopicum TaxID=703497 RepID=A0A6A6U1U8_9PEZI|nr:putative vacuolar cation/proton exchanger 2 [Microthyrium microscopicum]
MDSRKQEPYETSTPPHRDGDSLPTHNGTGTLKDIKQVRPKGESGRSGFHPWHFVRICFNSSCTLSKGVNILWPFVPVAFALAGFSMQPYLWNFIIPYIAMVPAANLLGFAGQQLARKVPHVLGVFLETTFGSVVEIIVFMVLIKEGDAGVPIIKAAILGSILANLLLCLGLCFFAGGLRRDEQEFHEAVSEVGSNLMLVAGMGLIVPAAFSAALNNTNMATEEAARTVVQISRNCAIVLFIAYCFFTWYQTRSHKGLYEDLLMEDEARDADGHRDMVKPKLTLVESLIAVAFALTMVSFMAIFLVHRIEYIVHRGVQDAFLGLILVPLVEKAAEHITAVDEAWDNQMNFALSHVLGASIQTALFNAPLVVFVGWGLHINMDLNFNQFDCIVLILAILVVGGFLRDKKSNYLEGALCVLVYVIIAISAFFFPNLGEGQPGEVVGH